MSTPLHTVKNDFGSKEALVEKLVPLLDRQDNESDGEFKERLMRVSNRKLLRLWQREQTLRSDFTNREQLVDQIVEAKLGRADTEFRNSLSACRRGVSSRCVRGRYERLNSFPTLPGPALAVSAGPLWAGCLPTSRRIQYQIGMNPRSSGSVFQVERPGS